MRACVCVSLCVCVVVCGHLFEGLAQVPHRWFEETVAFAILLSV